MYMLDSNVVVYFVESDNINFIIDNYSKCFEVSLLRGLKFR